MVEDYETTHGIEIELGGTQFRGRYRVLDGTVIVYFENEIKFARQDMNRSDMVAKWLLTDLARRVEARKRKAIASTHPSC